MFYCDMAYKGKLYRASVTDNEDIKSIVEVGADKTNRSGTCTVYESDGKTVCKNLYLRKRISAAVKKQLERRLKNMDIAK